MKTRFALTLLLAAVMLSSCDSTVFFDENRPVDADGWHMDDKLVFNIKAVDTTQRYLCCIDIRNSVDYPYSNIYFFINTVYPHGEIAVDTNIQFVLAAPDGQWLGKVSGSYVDGRYPFCYIQFPEPGIYQFSIQHAMRDTLLQGVKDVGLVLMTPPAE